MTTSKYTSDEYTDKVKSVINSCKKRSQLLAAINYCRLWEQRARENEESYLQYKGYFHRLIQEQIKTL